MLAPVILAAAAAMLLVAAAALFSYSLSADKEQLRRRIALLGFGRALASRKAATAAEHAVPRRLLSAALKGDELEFARRLAFFHIQPETAAQLLGLTRGAVAAATGLALVWVGWRYAGAATMPGLASWAVAGAVLGWLLPHIILGRLTKRRIREIARGLPDAIELLVIAVEAGLSLEDAIDRVVAELRLSQPGVADELAVMSADLKVLPNRDDALRRLAERVDLASVRSVVTTLSQTLKYGTPLAQALRVVAAELRNDSLLKLEEQANRLPVLLTVPMILFILPSLFLIIGGPAVLRVLDVFKK